MSRFADDKINGIKPYVPGEQLNDKKYVKLNTNENPYFTAKSAAAAVDIGLLQRLNRYSDPESKALCEAIADYYGVKTGNVLVTNGSDEALAFAFRTYAKKGVCFADVTYGFYSVFADLYDCDIKILPLNERFGIDAADYFNAGRTVVIANPNAQTGIAMPLKDVEKIIKSNADNIVIIDQAYADFNEENAIPLIKKYDNLIVVNTFSKSRSLAGARVGYVIANEKLIEDLKKLKYSFHPYNVNTLSMTLAMRAIGDEQYFKQTVDKIKCSRQRLSDCLSERGFTVLPSKANFVLAKTGAIGGKELYKKLKDRGVLVRHFDDERIKDFVRITVGTDEEIDALLAAVDGVIKEKI